MNRAGIVSGPDSSAAQLPLPGVCDATISRVGASDQVARLYLAMNAVSALAPDSAEVQSAAAFRYRVTFPGVNGTLAACLDSSSHSWIAPSISRRLVIKGGVYDRVRVQKEYRVAKHAGPEKSPVPRHQRKKGPGLLPGLA